LSAPVTVDPEDPENRRSYGWALYNLGEPAKAKEQFAMVDELAGGADEDVAVRHLPRRRRMGRSGRRQHALPAPHSKLAAEWGDTDYIKNLRGWTGKELTELERIRALATAKR